MFNRALAAAAIAVLVPAAAFAQQQPGDAPIATQGQGAPIQYGPGAAQQLQQPAMQQQQPADLTTPQVATPQPADQGAQQAVVQHITDLSAQQTDVQPTQTAEPSNVPPPVEQQQVAAPDAWSVSAVARGNGALPQDLWSHSDPANLVTLLDRLPATYDSPAAQTLALRVLLSGGDAPRGDSAEAARKRFEALGKMGAADPLATMAGGAGQALTDPVIAQYAAQAELARGNRDQACARGRAASITGPQVSPFLLRLRAFCSAATGDRAAADLALATPHTASADDAWYGSVIGAVAGAPPARLPAAKYDNSLSVQLSLAANLRPGPNAINNASTLALVTLARAETTPQPIRAQAAALAFRRAVLTTQQTRDILHNTPATVTAGLPSIATTLRAVEAAPGTVAAASAIATLLRAAAAPGDFAASARFFRADINALQQAPDAAATVQLARAAIVNGDVPVAQRLVASARQAGADEGALGPLDAAVAALTGLANDPITAMHRRIDAAGSVAAAKRVAARDLLILSALGAPADALVQDFIAANAPVGGARADAGAMLALTNAVDQHALGDAALLAVQASGRGPAKLDAESTSAIVRALRSVGLDNDARRFAIEAILAGAPTVAAAPAAATRTQ